MAGEEKKRLAVENGGGTPHPRHFLQRVRRWLILKELPKSMGARVRKSSEGRELKSCFLCMIEKSA